MNEESEAQRKLREESDFNRKIGELENIVYGSPIDVYKLSDYDDAHIRNLIEIAEKEKEVSSYNNPDRSRNAHDRIIALEAFIELRRLKKEKKLKNDKDYIVY